MVSSLVSVSLGFYTYLLECADGTLYAGWTTNLDQRLETHNAGRGAKYTRVRLPVSLKASWSFDSKVEAMRMEYFIKKLPRKSKLEMINEQMTK